MQVPETRMPFLPSFFLFHTFSGEEEVLLFPWALRKPLPTPLEAGGEWKGFPLLMLTLKRRSVVNVMVAVCCIQIFGHSYNHCI